MSEYLHSSGFVVNSSTGEALSGVASLTMSINSSYANLALTESGRNDTVSQNYIWLRCKATIIDDSEYQFDSFKMTVTAPDVSETEFTSPGYKEPNRDAYSSVLEGSSSVGWDIFSLIEGHTGSAAAKRAQVVFYAYFKPRLKEVTLSYDANGGTGAPEPTTAEEGAFSISDETPTRSGFYFLGWALTPTAEEAEYAPGQNIEIHDDVTLYAVWGLQPGPGPGPGPAPHRGYLTRNKASGYLQFVSSGHLAYD